MHPQFTPYTIPQEYRDELALAQNQLNSQMPGTALAEQNIFQNQANLQSALERGSRGSSGYLSGLMGLQGGTNAAFSNLQAMQGNYYQNRLANLVNAQNLMGSQQEKAYELNTYEPYLRELQRKYDLTGAGEQNIASGLSSLAEMSDLFGGGGGGKGPTQELGGQVGYKPMAAALPSLAPGGVAGTGVLAGAGGAAGGLAGIIPWLL